MRRAGTICEPGKFRAFSESSCRHFLSSCGHTVGTRYTASRGVDETEMYLIVNARYLNL